MSGTPGASGPAAAADRLAECRRLAIRHCGRRFRSRPWHDGRILRSTCLERLDAVRTRTPRTQRIDPGGLSSRWWRYAICCLLRTSEPDQGRVFVHGMAFRLPTVWPCAPKRRFCCALFHGAQDGAAQASARPPYGLEGPVRAEKRSPELAMTSDVGLAPQTV